MMLRVKIVPTRIIAPGKNEYEIRIPVTDEILEELGINPMENHKPVLDVEKNNSIC